MNAVIYARFSSHNQTEQSIEGQLKVCYEFAQKNGYLEAADKRAKTVCLTEEGKAYSQKTAVRIIEMENDIMRSWDKHDVELYLALTEKFLLDLKAKADAL